jgi:hypothetical protein
VGASCCIAYGGSFRGNEFFLVILFGLTKYARLKLEEGGLCYIIIPLLGRFKSEDGECYHLTPLAYMSESGINIGTWVEMLVEVKQKHHLTQGPAFSDHTGKLICSTWIIMEILDRLQEIQHTSPDLIQPDMDVYGVFRKMTLMQ